LVAFAFFGVILGVSLALIPVGLNLADGAFDDEDE